MKKILLLIVFISASLGVTYAKKNSGDLVGTWLSKCHNKKKFVFTFNADLSGIYKQISYESGLCLIQNKSKHVQFTYHVGNLLTNSSVVRELDVDLLVETRYENYIQKDSDKISEEEITVFELEGDKLYLGSKRVNGEKRKTVIDKSIKHEVLIRL